jgi:hypothetical protein
LPHTSGSVDTSWHFPVYPIWFWSIPWIFIISGLLSGGVAAVVLIFETNKSFKQYLNVLELIWVLGGSLSVIALISQSWGIVSPPLTQFMEDNVKYYYSSLHTHASSAFAQYCQGIAPLDETFCGLLKQIITIPEPTAQNTQELKQVVSSDTFRKAYNTARDKIHEDTAIDEGAAIDRLWDTASPIVWDLYEYNIAVEEIRFELTSVFPLPAWTLWLRAFAPQLFAFVFGVKVVRTIAAFWAG